MELMLLGEHDAKARADEIELFLAQPAAAPAREKGPLREKAS
jgi:hypothetical protein